MFFTYRRKLWLLLLVLQVGLTSCASAKLAPQPSPEQSSAAYDSAEPLSSPTLAVLDTSSAIPAPFVLRPFEMICRNVLDSDGELLVRADGHGNMLASKIDLTGTVVEEWAYVDGITAVIRRADQYVRIYNSPGSSDSVFQRRHLGDSSTPISRLIGFVPPNSLTADEVRSLVELGEVTVLGSEMLKNRNAVVLRLRDGVGDLHRVWLDSELGVKLASEVVVKGQTTYLWECSGLTLGEVGGAFAMPDIDPDEFIQDVSVSIPPDSAVWTDYFASSLSNKKLLTQFANSGGILSVVDYRESALGDHPPLHEFTGYILPSIEGVDGAKYFVSNNNEFLAEPYQSLAQSVGATGTARSIDGGEAIHIFQAPGDDLIHVLSGPANISSSLDALAVSLARSIGE